jgi:hypothetical protein
LQWDGYGTGLKETATVAAEEGHSVGVLYNDEVAAAASVTPRPVRDIAYHMALHVLT